MDAIAKDGVNRGRRCHKKWSIVPCAMVICVDEFLDAMHYYQLLDYLQVVILAFHLSNLPVNSPFLICSASFSDIKLLTGSGTCNPLAKFSSFWLDISS